MEINVQNVYEDIEQVNSQAWWVGGWVGGINQMQCIVFFEHLSRKTKPRPYQSPIKQTEIYIQFSV